MIKEMFAWVGEDETGDDGMKIISTPLGLGPAAFATLRVAQSDFVRNQMTGCAALVGKPMRLVRFTAADVLETINPNVKGQG